MNSPENPRKPDRTDGRPARRKTGEARAECETSNNRFPPRVKIKEKVPQAAASQSV